MSSKAKESCDVLSQHGLLPCVLSFLDLWEITGSIREVNCSWKEACDADSRWLPVIAPPSLARERLQLDRHGLQLRRLYAQYWKWWDLWDNLEDEDRRDRSSALDGFFSLAPWRRSSYPTPLLHRMVYRQQCPSQVAADTSTIRHQKDEETPTPVDEPASKRRRSSRLQAIRGRRDPRETAGSLFFQTRDRSNDEGRTFCTPPIEP